MGITGDKTKQQMEIIVSQSAKEMGQRAGSMAATLIRKAIREKGNANIILATGTSQFETLSQLVGEPDIEWSKVVMFHLDEYISLSIQHPASFRKYLNERFLTRVPALKAAHLIDGEKDPEGECKRLGELISKHPVDVALVGIGENGHLAFNDPPADFATEAPYIVVDLDHACRQQQLGEGWFRSLEEVPRQAISMSIRQIMKANRIICSVPDERKAPAVRNTINNPVGNRYPASILQQHAQCTLYLDLASASMLAPSGNLKKASHHE
jgi:glucosamine-6-phosphate deaminase